MANMQRQMGLSVQMYNSQDFFFLTIILDESGKYRDTDSTCNVWVIKINKYDFVNKNYSFIEQY